MNTHARRSDAPASGREQTALVVAPTPTPVDVLSGSDVLARHPDAPRAALASSRGPGPAVHLTEVLISITSTGVAR